MVAVNENTEGAKIDEPLTQKPEMLVGEKLVDRDEQVNQFTELLNRIYWQRPVSTNLYEWYGGPGIGKSVLVKLLKRVCDQEGALSVIINFADAEKRDTNADKADPTRLVEYIVTELVEQSLSLPDLEALNKAIVAYRETPDKPSSDTVSAYYHLSRDERLYRPPTWLGLLHDVRDKMVEFVNGCAKTEYPQRTRPVVLFFDETEWASVAFIDWVEEQIVAPLSRLSNCVIVWTARRPWLWRLPEIQKRIRSQPLSVFQEAGVKAQLETSTDHELAEAFFGNILQLTNGHPYANAVSIATIRSWQDAGKEVTEEFLSQQQFKVLQNIFEQFIRDYAWRGLNADLSTACELLSLVRFFDTTMLREVLKECGGSRFEKWDAEDFSELLQELKKTQLLIWQKGYAIDTDLRYIIRNYFEICRPKVYTAVNETALQVYGKLLDELVDSPHLYIVEELYHLACLSRPEDQLRQQLQKRLQQYQEQYPRKEVRLRALQRLHGELENDKELKKSFDNDSMQRLVSDVEEFIRLQESEALEITKEG